MSIFRVAGHHGPLPAATRRAALSCVAALSCALMACGSTPKPKPPTQVNAVIEASARINPSVTQRPSPLLVRVYELKSVTGFNSADFMSLYQRDQAELAADMLGREEFMLAPGETKAFTKTLAPETRFLGVMAVYRDLERSTWRSVVAVQPGKKHDVVIRAEELSVAATVKQ